MLLEEHREKSFTTDRLRFFFSFEIQRNETKTKTKFLSFAKTKTKLKRNFLKKPETMKHCDKHIAKCTYADDKNDFQCLGRY